MERWSGTGGLGVLGWHGHVMRRGEDEFVKVCEGMTEEGDVGGRRSVKWMTNRASDLEGERETSSRVEYAERE